MFASMEDMISAYLYLDHLYIVCMFFNIFVIWMFVIQFVRVNGYKYLFGVLTWFWGGLTNYTLYG